MTRSSKKRGRSTVQPRLTAFLQPTLVPPSFPSRPCPVVAAELRSKGECRSSEAAKLCGPVVNARDGELDQRAGLGGSGRYSNQAGVCLHDEQVSGPVLWRTEAPSEAANPEFDAGGRAIGQKLSAADRGRDLTCSVSVTAVEDQDTDTTLKVNEFKQSVEQSATLVCMDAQKGRSVSSKCSLEAFVKRRRVEPLRGSERNAAVGRAVNGSAYAQCPLCTMHIPLMRMNHHLDIECVQRCTETSTFHPPSTAQIAKHSKNESPAMAFAGAEISAQDQRCSPPPDETINEHPQDTPAAADVSRDGADVSECVSEVGRCADVLSRESVEEAGQLGRGECEGVAGVRSSCKPGGDGRPARAFSKTGFGTNQGLVRGVEVDGRGEVRSEQLDEVAGEFEVMPTLDAWLPEVNRDSQGPVHNEGGAHLDILCEQVRGRTEAFEYGQGSMRVVGHEAENPGHVLPARDCECVEGREQERCLDLGRTKEAKALHLQEGQRLSELMRTPLLLACEAVLHEQTESTFTKPVVEHNPSLGSAPHSSSQLQKGSVSDQMTDSRNQTRNETVPTTSPSRKEPVNSLLGMVRERGQRPLFGLSWAAIQMRQPSAPKGHYLVENFLTEQEEAHILASLDADVSNPWVTSRVFGDVNEGKAYGMVTDLRRRTISKPKRPMPAFLQSVLARIRTVAPSLSNFAPNECNAINYRREDGHWLRAHVDDRQLSGTIIAGISLHSDCVMTYERERGRPEKFRVRLPRRCLQVQTQDSRYNYTHSIKNADLLGERRVSITFRQVAEPHS